MKSHRTDSYDYNATCDVCGFTYKASQLRQRWDGYMVCAADFEYRNILDFYRPKNDNHQLPYIRIDGEVELTWTPSFTNITFGGAGLESKTGTYKQDSNNIVNMWVQINLLPGASVTSTSGEVDLPTVNSQGGTIRVFDKAGVFLGPAIILPGNTTAALPSWIANTNNIIISGRYGV